MDTFDLLKEKASRGDQDALVQIADICKAQPELYQWRIGPLSWNNVERSAADAGRVWAMMAIGKRLLAHGHENVALQWLRKCAEKRVEEALLLLGDHYSNSDPSIAVKYFEIAATLGSQEGLFRLGKCYLEGNGVAINQSEAISHLLKAESAGSSRAGVFVVRAYLTGSLGDSIPPSDITDILERSSKRSEPDAHFLLAKLQLDSGANSNEAIRLLDMAARRGHVEARELHVGLTNRIFLGQQFGELKPFIKALKLWFDSSRDEFIGSQDGSIAEIPYCSCKVGRSESVLLCSTTHDAIGRFLKECETLPLTIKSARGRTQFGKPRKVVDKISVNGLQIRGLRWFLAKPMETEEDLVRVLAA